MNDSTIRPNCILHFSHPGTDTLLIRLSGSWKMGSGIPADDALQKQLEVGTATRRIAFDTRGISEWDSGLLMFLKRIIERARLRGIKIDKTGLPQGVQRLLALASAVPEREGARREMVTEPVLERIGKYATRLGLATLEMLEFIGEATLAFGRMLVGRACYRRSDLALVVQSCGPQALGIVTVISYLVGLIMAFIGAVQLEKFAAQIYVADLVGLGMAREMAPMMVAIIMAGRTGAAFAAQLGTMRVNEEIDALTTLGIRPMEFLVLPRLLALALMLPLLTLYANLLGMLGGCTVTAIMFDISPLEYFIETRSALSLNDFLVGLSKSAIYGVLVAVAGCMRGMHSGNSASAVGEATTSAVVTAIVFVIVASALTTIIYTVLGI